MVLKLALVWVHVQQGVLRHFVSDGIECVPSWLVGSLT